MKRFFILISCMLLIVSLSVVVLAAPVSWSDYVVTVIPGIDYDINSVFIPPSKALVQWRYNGSTTVASSFTFTVSQAGNVGLTTQLFSANYPLSIEGIEGQDTLEVFFRFSDSRLPNLTNVVYYWNDGTKNIKTVWTGFKQTGWDYSFTVDLTQKPEGATALVFSLETAGELSAGDYTIEFLGISFDVLSAGTLTPPDPMIIEPVDYLVNESSNGTTSTLHVSVPAEVLSLHWQVLRDDDYSVVSQSFANPYQISLGPPADFQYWIDCLVMDYLDVSDIVDGSTMTVHFKILPELNGYTVDPSSVRYQVRYYDGFGNLLDTVHFFEIAGADTFDDTNVEIPIDKPAGTATMRFYLQYMDLEGNFPALINLELESINFACDIPTMVRVQQETGRTNQLLNELVNGDHGFDSSGSNFGSDADNLAGAGDQMDDAMGSGMDALGSMTNSQAFTGTVATLTALVGTVFEGHEITICGITANPFTLAATVLSVAVLLPLALKYVFRKRGSG